MRCVSLLFGLVAVAAMACGLAAAAPTPNAMQLMWAFNVSSDPSASFNFGYPAYSEGRAFLAGTNTANQQTTLWALSAFTGEVLWTWNTSSAGGMYVDAGAGAVFVGTLDGLFAINATTGQRKWFFDQSSLPHAANAPDGHWPGKPSFRYSDESLALVYVTWYDTPMVAIMVENGVEAFRTMGPVASRIWQTRRGFYFYQLKDNTSSTTGAMGYYLTRYDPLERTPMWQNGPVSDIYTTAAATADALASKMKFNDTWAELIISNVTDGSVLRRVQASSHFDYNVAQGKIFQFQPRFDAGHPDLVCFCGKTGTTLWTSSIPSTFRGFNVISSDNYILLQGAAQTWVVSAVDGTILYAIDAASPSFGTVVDGDKYVMGFGGNAIGAFRLTIGEPMH